jgi:hypothetical protein
MEDLILEGTGIAPQIEERPTHDGLPAGTLQWSALWSLL